MDFDKIFTALRNCITEPKCKDCPWEQCEQFNQKKVSIPLTLALDVLNLLKEQEHKDRMFHALEEDWKRLKEQESIEPKWTSVKERYPEKEGFYLVSADHGNYHPWIAEMRIFRGIKGFCNGAAMPCIGAWMPLPEPYKEGR